MSRPDRNHKSYADVFGVTTESPSASPWATPKSLDIEGGNVKILFFESLALKAFWWGKFVLRKLKIA
jgi:hypothetical protein